MVVKLIRSQFDGHDGLPYMTIDSYVMLFCLISFRDLEVQLLRKLDLLTIVVVDVSMVSMRQIINSLLVDLEVYD